VNEAAEAVQGREIEVAGPGADGGAAVDLDEVDGPGVAVQPEVEEDPGHATNIGAGAMGVIHSTVACALGTVALLGPRLISVWRESRFCAPLNAGVGKGGRVPKKKSKLKPGAVRGNGGSGRSLGRENLAKLVKLPLGRRGAR
jgi:hypothetical protein